MKNHRQNIETAEAGLEEVLKNFRQSVYAWSNAELARPRTVSLSAHQWSWRRASAWALGCVLAAGSLSAGMFAHYRQEIREQLARQAQQRQLAAEQAAAQARMEAAARDDASLMAAVDKDVSQEVPSAMEPLAQMMDDSSNK